jgi:transcriptional regulator with XRE-family HTH domain
MTDPISKTMIKARGKMSKRELARLADMNTRQVRAIEEHVDTVGVGVLRRAADALGYTVTLEPKKP